MNIRNVTEGTSTTVEFECDASGQVTMPPCVQYFDGGCSSMVFTGMIKSIHILYIIVEGTNLQAKLKYPPCMNS